MGSRGIFWAESLFRKLNWGNGLTPPCAGLGVRDPAVSGGRDVLGLGMATKIC